MSITLAADDLSKWPRVEAELRRLDLMYFTLPVAGFAAPRVFFGPEELIGESEILAELPRLKRLLDE